MEEKNLHYRSVLGTRRLQVSALPIQVTAAGDDPADLRAADLVRDFCEGPVLQGSLFDILDAVGKGFSVSELIWDLQSGEWRPDRIEWRFPQWFVFDRVDGKTILMRGGPGDGAAAFQVPAGELDRGNFGTPLAPRKFITHIHRSKSGLPIRGGLARPAAWAYMFQNFTVKSWAVFLEVYGHPLRVGKYEFGASKEDKAILLKAVRNIAADAAAIIPSTMDIEFVDAPSVSGGSFHQTNLDWWNAQISKLVLGQTGTTDTGQYVGTADAHEHVRGDIRDDDAAQLASTIARDVVKPMVDLNIGPRPRYPSIRIGEPETEDLTGLTDNVKTFVSLGGQVAVSWMGGKLGIPAPEPGEPVLKAPAPPPAFGAPPPDGEDEENPEGLDAPDLNPPPGPKAGKLSVQSQLPQGALPSNDALDSLQDDQLADWHPLVKPLIDPIQALMEECQSLEEFQARLPELLAKQDPTKLATSLAQAAFAAKLAGLTGASIAPDPDDGDAG
jgi:phage gp29-like protein